MKWFRFIALLVCTCFIVQTNTSAKMIKRKEIEPSGQVIWDVPTQKKLIALTFDDGPSPIYTPQVLTILERFGAACHLFPNWISNGALSRYR